MDIGRAEKTSRLLRLYASRTEKIGFKMWNLYKNNELISPLLYSNEQGQDTVIRDVIEAFESYDIVFLLGAVGTGKSVISLSAANKLGGGIIVVPTKVLQQQYENDYCKGSYKILKDNKDWLKIRQIKGRVNFRCLYKPKLNCNHVSLPCICPLPHETIYECLNCGYRTEEEIKICSKCKHDEISKTSKRISRLEIAKECPYYSPVVRSSLEASYRKELDCMFESIKYEGVGSEFSILRRDEEVCLYYQQYREYESADVILMNSAIWLIESLVLKRKPKKPIEVIDEGDAFLDGLTLKKSISRRILNNVENKLVDEEKRKAFEKIKNQFVEITKTTYEGDIGTKEKEFLKQFIKFLESIGDESSGKYSDIQEFMDECYVSVTNKGIEYFIPEPKIVVKKLLNLSAKKMLFMSATFQSEKILEEIFGFDNFCFIEGEPKFPGIVYPKKLGTENRVTYKMWKHEEFKRQYWRNLVNAIKQSAKPVMIPVHAFKYLPEGIREKLKGQGTLRTKNGDITFSTVMKRGVDLKDDQCRSIVMLKFPFPDVNDSTLKAMKLKLGDGAFWMYYRDMAKREFIQTIGRGVRHKEDWVELYSPDKTVFGFLDELWEGEIDWNGKKQIKMEV